MSQLSDGLTPKQKELLERILRLSTDSAAVALSRMTEKPVFLESPCLDVVSLDSITNTAGGAESSVISAYLIFSGEINGNMLLVFPEQNAFKLINEILRQDDTSSEDLDEMAISVLGEVGNLVSSYFLSTLSDYTGIDLRLSSPMVVQDMIGAIISSAILMLERTPEEILCIETEIADENSKIEGYLMLFTDKDSLDKLLQIIEVR